MSAVETPVIELDDDEYALFLAREVDRGTGLAVPGFIEAYTTGRLDDADPEVARLAALLALGQNGR